MWSLAQIDGGNTFNRMLWRHNCILEKLVQAIEPFIQTRKGMKLLVDLPNSKYGYSTLPPPLVFHNKFRPDMVILEEWEEQRKVIIVELTSPYSHNAAKRHEEKMAKYEHMADELPLAYESTVITFEVSADLGQVSKSIDVLFDILKVPKTKRCAAKRNMTETAVRCSSTMFIAKDQKFWSPPTNPNTTDDI